MIGKLFNFDFGSKAKIDQPKQVLESQFYRQELYTEEEYDKLIKTMFKTTGILEKAGLHGYMVRGGFVADLLGKEMLNKLAKFKASDVDIDVSGKEIDDAVAALKEEGFILEDQKFIKEEAEPALFKFRDLSTQVPVDIFRMGLNNSHLAKKFKIRGADVNLQSPISLYEITKAEVEGRIIYEINFPESTKEQRHIKVSERLEMLKSILEKSGINPDNQADWE